MAYLIGGYDGSNKLRMIAVTEDGYVKVVGAAELPAGTQIIGSVKLTDGTETATVTEDGYLNVKTHSPDLYFTGDYAAAQTNLLIVTPSAGKKILLSSVFVSTGSTSGNIMIIAQTSGKILLKIYTDTFFCAHSVVYAGKTDADEGIKLTCPANTFINIGYEEK